MQPNEQASQEHRERTLTTREHTFVFCVVHQGQGGDVAFRGAQHARGVT